MQQAPKESGWIEIITGPMFSGKTEELIRRLKRAAIARQKIQIFKPARDTRHHTEKIVSHADQKLIATPVPKAREILIQADEDVKVVGVDEVQFFDSDVVKVCEELANRGVRVICAGLDLDFRGFPFPPMPLLLAVSEFVTKQSAICVRCGEPAFRSQRITALRARVVIGAEEAYEARCRKCFNPDESPSPGDQLHLIELRRIEGRFEG